MADLKQFQQIVWDYYHDYGRDLPWRRPEADGTFDPYKIMVSELMLQQTQVSRVIPKYLQFLKVFPTTESLAQAPLADVLRQWSGLGYNRRAKFLWQSAQQIRGSFPETLDELIKLPGIGTNTAGAILAYAFNQPVVFIETNIRTVYIHHFFPGQIDVTDKQLLPLLEKTLDAEHPREWYWALMDYGSYLKTTVGNLSQNSRHYAKQSTFHGSKRQIRGQVLRELAGTNKTFSQLKTTIQDERLRAVLDDLTKEGLIQYNNHDYSL